MPEIEYKPYTGIGSRKTPRPSLQAMKTIAERLNSTGFTLRSGGAGGADSAFETGAGELKEIFLPWRGFNDHLSNRYNIPAEATALASQIHPAWHACSQGAQKLHARNIQQVLGQDLQSPSLFVIFWAPEKNGEPQGGTATAVRLAKSKGIPVFNLLNHSTEEVLQEISKLTTCK